MEKQVKPFDLIIQSLAEKASLKVDIANHVTQMVDVLKVTLKSLESEIITSLSKIDKRIGVKFLERGRFDLEFRISDDIIMFSVHTDSFIFPEHHPIWKTSYIHDNQNRAFCGMISIYNFLTDSIQYNRVNDQGILIARIFINHENHFFVEGKKQLGVLFNDFENAVVTPESIRQITELAILHCLEIDAMLPSFEHSKAISVHQIIEKSLSSVITTGKRLGFKLQSDSDLIQ